MRPAAVPPAAERRAGDALVRAYDAALALHGDTAAGALWPNERDRETRFSVMLDVVERAPSEAPTLCDFACGSGAMLAYVRKHVADPIRYFGVDRSSAAIAIAAEKFPGERFFTADVASDDCDLAALACDYLVIDGLFCMKFELSYDDMWTFLASTIGKVWPHVRKGIAFNVMSKVVDWERDDLFHVPMDDVARLLHGLAGRNVRLRADYGLHEYTAYAYKRSR